MSIKINIQKNKSCSEISLCEWFYSDYDNAIIVHVDESDLIPNTILCKYNNGEGAYGFCEDEVYVIEPEPEDDNSEIIVVPLSHVSINIEYEE